jgi:hypothetical protein
MPFTVLLAAGSVIVTVEGSVSVEWAQETIEKLHQGRWEEVELDYLLEELGEMTASDRDTLRNRLPVLYLLKWQYQPERQGRSSGSDNSLSKTMDEHTGCARGQSKPRAAAIRNRRQSLSMSSDSSSEGNKARKSYLFLPP